MDERHLTQRELDEITGNILDQAPELEVYAYKRGIEIVITETENADIDEGNDAPLVMIRFDTEDIGFFMHMYEIPDEDGLYKMVYFIQGLCQGRFGINITFDDC